MVIKKFIKNITEIRSEQIPEAKVSIRRLECEQLGALKELLQELAAFHNQVATSFAGDYPLFPLDEQIANMAEEMREDRALVAVLEEDDRLVGFAKASFMDRHGEIDYLYVREHLRGTGLGRLLMDHMLAYLKANGVEFIEVRVVDGNPARGFYEEYGFRVRSLLMAKEQ